MQVHINQLIYKRTKDYSESLGLTVSQFVELALSRAVGLEHVTSNENQTKEEEKNESTPVSQRRMRQL